MNEHADTKDKADSQRCSVQPVLSDLFIGSNYYTATALAYTGADHSVLSKVLPTSVIAPWTRLDICTAGAI